MDYVSEFFFLSKQRSEGMNKFLIVLIAAVIVAGGAIVYVCLTKEDDAPKVSGIDYGEGFEMISTVGSFAQDSETSHDFLFETVTSSSNMLRMNIGLRGTGLSTVATIMKLSETSYSATIDSASLYYYTEYVPSVSKWMMVVTSEPQPKIDGSQYVLSYDRGDNILFRLAEVVINTFNLCTSGPYQPNVEELFDLKNNPVSESVLMTLRSPQVCFIKHQFFGDSGEKFRYVIIAGSNVIRTNDSGRTDIADGTVLSRSGYHSGAGVNVCSQEDFAERALQQSIIYDSDIGLVCSYTIYENGKEYRTLNINYVKHS